MNKHAQNYWSDKVNLVISGISDIEADTNTLVTNSIAPILISDTVLDSSESHLIKAVIVGKNTDGDYVNVKTDLDDKLLIRGGITTLYGEAIVVQYTPIIQSNHFYGFTNISQWFETFTATGGTITNSLTGNAVDMNITSSVGSFAVLRSKRVMKYRHGFTNTMKIGAKFDTGIANSLQFVGMGNAGSDLYFAMNGVDFGVRRSYGGLLEIRKLTITAASSAIETAVITLNGVAFNVNLTNAATNVNFTSHEIEIGTYTGWTVEHINNTVFFIGGAVGSRPGTYSFVSGTATATFAQIKAGAALTTEFIAQADWNGNSPMKTTLDPVLYNNLYQIDYNWFGSGNIEFKVYNNLTGDFETVHKMIFSNFTSTYSLSSPNMYIQRGLASLGSTTAMSMTSSGAFGGTIGNYNANKLPKASTEAEKAISASTETVILTLTNRRQINGYSNQSEIFLETVNIAVDGNRAVRVNMIKNPTTLSADILTDFTDFQFTNEDEDLLLFDNTVTTETGGTILRTFTIGKNGSVDVDLSDKEIFLSRDDVIAFTAFSTAINTVDISVNVLMDI